MDKFITMFRIEFALSLRGLDMLIFAIIMPAVVALLLGGIYQDSAILAQSFGSLSTIAICAGGVMGLPLLIADYRQKKILKRLQVTPSSPSFLLSVWLTIYVVYCLISLLVITFVLTIVFKVSFAGSVASFLLAYLLVMLAMFSIGLMVGGVAPDIKMASVLASVLYFPMLIFSGATIPYEVLPYPLQQMSGILPLTQGVKLLKVLSQGSFDPALWSSILSLSALLVVCTVIAIKNFKWE